jgi:hypothetical protein
MIKHTQTDKKSTVPPIYMSCATLKKSENFQIIPVVATINEIIIVQKVRWNE